MLLQAQLHKLSKYTDLERENKNLKEETNKLKEEVHNKLLLEEEVHDLKSRLITFKEREQQLVNLQVKFLSNTFILRYFYFILITDCPIASRNAVGRMEKLGEELVRKDGQWHNTTKNPEMYGWTATATRNQFNIRKSQARIASLIHYTRMFNFNFQNFFVNNFLQYLNFPGS